jgi:aspartokinase
VPRVGATGGLAESLAGARAGTKISVAVPAFGDNGRVIKSIEIISTSIRISCVVRAADVERAVRAVHERFGLAEEAGAPPGG